MTGAIGISGVAGVNSIIGSTGNDLVALTTPGTGTITIAGAGSGTAFSFINDFDGGTGTNTLDYSGFAGAIAVNLQTGSATGTSSITNFNDFVGNATPGSNSLTGQNIANTWDITADNAGTINPLGTPVTFAGFGSLQGGTLVDEFDIADGVSLAGTVAGNGGTDILDYAADTLATTINLSTSVATGIFGGAAGGISSIESFTGGTSGGNSLTSGAGADVWTVDSANSGFLNGVPYNTFQTINGGGGNDTVTINVGGSVATLIDGGIGINTLLGSGFANVWNITGNNSGTLNGNPFARFANLTAVGAGATLTQTAGVGLSGTMTAGTVTVGTATLTAGANPFNVVGNLVSSSASQSITSGGPFSVTGTIDDAGSAFTINATGVAIGGIVNTSAFTAASNGGNYSSGTVTSGTFNVTTAGGNFVSGPITTTGATSIIAGGGTANVFGVINAASVTTASSSTQLRAVTTTGGQVYGGNTSFSGNLTGANMTFNGTSTFNGDVLLQSSTNVWDFNVAVSGTGNFDIIPTANTDIFIGNGNGPGNIASSQFGGFLGHLIIGAQLNPLDSPAEDAVVVMPPGVTADLITVEENFLVGGDVTLIGSNIMLDSGVSGAAGTSQVTLIAVGDSQGTGGAAPGDIIGPTSGTSIIGGGKAVLVANNGIVNAGNIRLDLNGGELLLAVYASQDEPTFDASSSATSVTFDPTTIAIIASLGLNLQSIQVVFSNPASALTGLQNVQFIDVGLSEEELSLFGVIGNGIALSLDQCEEAEGCAPNVSEEEIEALIAQIEGRIAGIERRLASGEIDSAEGQQLLAGFQQELKNYQTYQEQLAEFNESQQEFGDDFGELDDFAEEFDDAEPTAADDVSPTDAAEFEAPQIAAPEPEPEVEPTEEAFEELEDEFIEQEIPADEFEDLEVDLEKDIPGLDDVPAAAPDEFEDLDEEFDEFEELGTEIDPSLLLRLTQSANVNEYHGALGIGVNGRVVWTGDIVLPSFGRNRLNGDVLNSFLRCVGHGQIRP